MQRPASRGLYGELGFERRADLSSSTSPSREGAARPHVTRPAPKLPGMQQALLEEAAPVAPEPTAPAAAPSGGSRAVTPRGRGIPGDLRSRPRTGSSARPSTGVSFWDEGSRVALEAVTEGAEKEDAAEEVDVHDEQETLVEEADDAKSAHEADVPVAAPAEPQAPEEDTAPSYVLRVLEAEGYPMMTNRVSSDRARRLLQLYRAATGQPLTPMKPPRSPEEFSPKRPELARLVPAELNALEQYFEVGRPPKAARSRRDPRSYTLNPAADNAARRWALGPV